MRCRPRRRRRPTSRRRRRPAPRHRPGSVPTPVSSPSADGGLSESPAVSPSDPPTDPLSEPPPSVLPSGAEPDPPSDPSTMSEPVTGGGRSGFALGRGTTGRDGAPPSDLEARSSRSESRLDRGWSRGACRPTGSPPSGRRRRGRRRSTTIRTAWCRPVDGRRAERRRDDPRTGDRAAPGSPGADRAVGQDRPHRGTADCNAAITCLTGASAAARGRGSAGGGTAAGPASAASSTPTPEMIAPSPRALLPSTVVTASSAPAATAARWVDVRAPASRRSRARGTSGRSTACAARRPSRRSREPTETRPSGSGSGDAMTGRTREGRVRGRAGERRRMPRSTPFAGERGSGVACCLYDNTADHHTRPPIRILAVAGCDAHPTCVTDRSTRPAAPSGRAASYRRAFRTLSDACWRAPGFHPVGPAGHRGGVWSRTSRTTVSASPPAWRP